jgi:hypothetical protein
MPELNYADVLALISSAEERRDAYARVEMTKQVGEMNVIIAKLELMKQTASVY